MVMSGDEELSDQEQNPELEDYGDEDEYDHDYEPEVDEDGDELEDSEYAICGYSESDPVHGS